VHNIFLIITILTWVRGNLIVFLIGIFLVISNIEHLYVFFGEMPIKSYCSFSKPFFLVICGFLYIHSG
jgi:hypothetical protein